MSQSRSLCTTSGQKSRPIRSPLSRRLPDLLSTGAPKQGGDNAGSVLPRLPTLPAFRRREILPSIFVSLSTSLIESRNRLLEQLRERSRTAGALSPSERPLHVRLSR